MNVNMTSMATPYLSPSSTSPHIHFTTTMSTLRFHLLPSFHALRAVFLVAMLSQLLFSSCTTDVPSTYVEVKDLPSVYPDYIGVTVPVNIAPLHFHIDHDSTATDFVTRLSAGNEAYAIAGDNVRPGLKKWRKLLTAALAAEGKISAEVFIKKNDKWQRHQPFTITVSKDSIDPYISYRLISPSYVTYEDLTLNQRCL